MTAVDDITFESHVRRHHRRVLAYALALVPRRDVAEDLVQDAFVSAYEAFGRFDGARDFGAWMRGIVRNKVREWARKQRDIPLDSMALDAAEAQHRLWDSTEQRPGDVLRALEHCLGKLPEPARRAVELFYMKQLSGAEVAARLASSAAAVRKRLERARRQLGACVDRTLTAVTERGGVTLD